MWDRTGFYFNYAWDPDPREARRTVSWTTARRAARSPSSPFPSSDGPPATASGGGGSPWPSTGRSSRTNASHPAGPPGATPTPATATTQRTPITGNDPADTSVAAGPALVTGWMDHIAARLGGNAATRASGSTPSTTSRCSGTPPTATFTPCRWTMPRSGRRPSLQPPPSRRRTRGVTFGPVVWGWCAYFYSAADGCAPRRRPRAHGPFLEWYLAQAEAYRIANGVRLVDYLDIHLLSSGR